MYELSSVGSKTNDVLLDSCFVEIEPYTGQVRFSWRASRHFHPSASYHAYEPETQDAWGGWHINSLQKTVGDHYIFDLGHAHIVVLINGTNGWPIWNLGDRAEEFEDFSGGKATALVQYPCPHISSVPGSLGRSSRIDPGARARCYQRRCDAELGRCD